ncbi:MAG TPA: macro domain-containing protein [Tepidisphaeraceae bacterium]|nr:macro domain-containing protein [Tepidisphaeraceae bacterium]
MLVRVTLVDINPKMVEAWRSTFEANPEVEIVKGSMLEQPVSAWVSPTNARGSMDGGLDAVIKRHLGPGIESNLQAQIIRKYGMLNLPVGHAVAVPTGQVQPRYLISTPTMVGSSEDISDSMNVALACAAAFQAVHMQNAAEPGSVRSVALPGLGANTGQVPVEICADLMWTAYNLFREREFDDFGAMRVALQDILGDLGPMGTVGKSSASGGVPKKAKPAPAVSTAPSEPAPKKNDEDFDDFG